MPYIVLLCFLNLHDPCPASPSTPETLIASAISSFPWLQPAGNDATPQTPAPTYLTDKWIAIPEWLAGTWQANSQLLIYSYSYRQKASILDAPVSVAVHRVSTIGAQRDSSGQIWHFIGTPYERTVETKDYIECQQMENIVLSNCSQNTLTVRCSADVRHLDRSTNETLDHFFEETTTTYEPLQNDLIQVTFTVTDYDLQGRPKNSSKSVCTETRTKPFQTIDQDSRGNLHQLFVDFQKRNKSLIPCQAL